MRSWCFSRKHSSADSGVRAMLHLKLAFSQAQQKPLLWLSSLANTKSTYWEKGKKKNPLSPQSNHSFLKFMCLNRENELGAFFLYVYEIKLLNKKGAGIAAKDGSKNKQGTSSHRASHCMSGDWLRLLFVCASRLVRQSLFSPALWFTLLVTLASAPLGWTTTAGQQGAGAPGQISHLEHRACQRHFNVTPVLA